MKKMLLIIIGLVIVVALVGPFGSGYVLENRVTTLLESIKKSLPDSSLKYGNFQRGWFGSDIKVSIKDKSVSIDAMLHISHGPVLFKKGSLIFGLGYIDIKVADVQSKVTGLGVVKELFKQARVDIVLNYQSTVTIDATINKLLKPIIIEKFKLRRLNNFRFNIKIRLDDEIGKSILVFDDLEVSKGSAGIIIKHYDSSMTLLKSHNGASIGDTIGKAESLKFKYNANGKTRKITITGLNLRTSTKVVSGQISQDSSIEIKAIAIPGKKLLSLKIPLKLNKIDEKQFIQYEKLVSVRPLNVLELSKVITKIIAGEPEIWIKKSVLKLAGKEANMTLLLKGVPLKKGDIINIFNFRKAIYFKSTISVPKDVMKELLSMGYQLVYDLNKAENNPDVDNASDGNIKEWLGRKIITETAAGYSLDLEIKDGKMYLNGEQQKSFLFP